MNRARAARQRSEDAPSPWERGHIHVRLGDSARCCGSWPSPHVIVSDGAYGILGFEGDAASAAELGEWYEPHVAAWSARATPSTTLWFWNSEIGWANVHPTLARHGWTYVNANVWNKGLGHVAGNVNTRTLRRFPVVTEVCVQYVFEARINGLTLKEWLLAEWKRTGLALRLANEACGVANAATRKYLDQGHLWYFPPALAFERMQRYANERGAPEGRPYFSLDGKTPCFGSQWEKLRPTFRCPHGMTNVWERPQLRGPERETIEGSSSKAAHLNQKPLDLVRMLIEASSNPGDVVWEPFGGLFTTCLAAGLMGREAHGAEINPAYYAAAIRRLERETRSDDQ